MGALLTYILTYTGLPRVRVGWDCNCFDENLVEITNVEIKSAFESFIVATEMF